MTVANSPVQLFIFGIFEHKWGTRKHIDDLKKYSWCIPVQKEIKPIIWGAAITPEPWNRQQCWFIFEDPNVRVARLLRPRDNKAIYGCQTFKSYAETWLNERAPRWYSPAMAIVAFIHRADGRLTVRSREVSKPQDWMLLWSYHSEMWQAARQPCCRGVCQISERLETSKPESRGFEISRDLTVRRPPAYWIKALAICPIANI